MLCGCRAYTLQPRHNLLDNLHLLTFNNALNRGMQSQEVLVGIFPSAQCMWKSNKPQSFGHYFQIPMIYFYGKSLHFRVNSTLHSCNVYGMYVCVLFRNSPVRRRIWNVITILNTKYETHRKHWKTEIIMDSPQTYGSPEVWSMIEISRSNDDEA